MSESRQENFRISISNITPHTVRSSRQPIDYLLLNDGYEDETLDNPKQQHKDTYRPRSGPSANRLAAHKRMSSPESVTVEEDAPAVTLSAVPTKSGDGETLTGIPVEDQKLPDLVVNQNELDTVEPVNVEQAAIAVNIVSTEEDLKAASMLLSLGDTHDDTLDDDDENAQLMPIGGINVPVDVAPEPLRLDQVGVDNIIAGIVETEELEKDLTVGKTTSKPAEEESATAEPLPDMGDQADNEPVAMKGSLKTKTYVLKKKPDSKRTFKCSECKAVETSIHKLNEHHRWMHNPQMCGFCNSTFALASSLSRHMYDHDEKKFHCNQCDYSSHFESELEMHKIVHRKNPSYQCMHAKCGKWFHRKWDFMLHLQKHDGKEQKCDYEGCKFVTATKKQLKEHQKKHSDDYPYECKICNKGF